MALIPLPDIKDFWSSERKTQINLPYSQKPFISGIVLSLMD
jgi:hypothetical protein